MSYTVTLQQRIQQLKKAQANLPDILYRVQKGAAMRAVEAAKEATPPAKGEKTGRLAGPNMITGRLLDGWNKSKVEPEVSANKLTSYLINNMDYASYVDQGHRMDRHFVPGLYVNPGSGLLEYDPSAKAGLVVGTKTKYVKGEFMVDKAKEAYQKTILAELDKEIGRLLK